MSAMPHEPLTQADVLLEGFLALDTPEGFRAELIEGEIVVTPPPDGDHEDCISLILKQVIRHARTDMDFSGNKGLKLRSGGGCPENHVIPDGTFAPAELRLFRGRNPGCHVTGWRSSSRSPRPNPGPTVRTSAIATPAVPSLSTCSVDREESSVTLFSDPERDDYRQHCTIPFGKPLGLPAPFAFDLETAAFV